MQERKKKNGANRSNHCNVDVNDDIHETANTEFYFKRQEKKTITTLTRKTTMMTMLFTPAQHKHT